MQYIERNDDDEIVALFAVEQHPDQECLADDHPEVIAFKRKLEPEVIVTKLRLVLALHAAGKLDDIEAAIAGGPLEARLYWSNATMIERDHPLVIAMGAAAGLSPAEIDAVFEVAGTTDA